MFNVGDLVIYSVHGLCEIDDISEKSYGKVTRNYYVMHPLENPKLTISNPVDSDQVVMLAVMGKKEAAEIIQSFQKPGISWIEDARERAKKYNSLVNTGDRKEISKVVNTLMKVNIEASRNNQRINTQDRDLLTNTQNVMFKELALSLDTSFEDISEKVNSMISLQE
ncbi:CarD family transcriptional regulator [Virgibacillus sp. NKC19-16]|uniref:CarD family transcriptional regulator n=1 Tax=Virgibacillus salidurans TaxID=2831673 RepID=UPI001F400D35|nr:CarD family transcriptional regulator [Virgibacillus sp. NKC19-16]UJL47379.1 CarD family transcriptional regulator [Virgibacillus sp. NKC19-16]